MTTTTVHFVTNNASSDCAPTLPGTPVLSYPPLPIAADGVVRLGSQTPTLQMHATSASSLVRLGGQAPMLCPELIIDKGLVRLGGQSPIF